MTVGLWRVGKRYEPAAGPSFPAERGCLSCGTLERPSVVFPVSRVLAGNRIGGYETGQSYAGEVYVRLCDLCLEEARAGLALFVGRP